MRQSLFVVTALLAALTAGCLPAAPAARARVNATVAAREVAAAPSGVFETDDPGAFERVVALSDVHGMYPAAARLLQAGGVIDGKGRWAGGKTLLVIDGDSIDKGPQSLDVLDMWIALATQAQAAGGRVVHVLGNHEAEFLADPTNGKADDLRDELARHHLTVDDLTNPAHPHGAFLAAEPVAARVGRWLFCHAGLYPRMSWAEFRTAATAVLAKRAYGDPLLVGSDSILEAKDWWEDASTRSDLEARLKANGMIGMVQGHQPKAYGAPGRVAAIDGGRLIKVDNGMAPEAGANPGSLLVFPHAEDLGAEAVPRASVVFPDGRSVPLLPAALPPGSQAGP